MATSFHPSDIQYVSDSNIQLQSMQYIGGNQASYQDSHQPYQDSHPPYQDSHPHDFYENGNYSNGSSSAHTSPSDPSSTDHEIIMTEEEETKPIRTEPPKDYMSFSLFIMILFCSPIGLTAVQSSRQCRKAIAMRNLDIAYARSEEAKGRAFLGLVTGIASWIVIASFIIVGVLS